MPKHLNSAVHKENREAKKFQRGETTEQRKDLAEIMQAQKNAKTLFDRIQVNINDVPYHGNVRLERDMKGVQYYIEKYWENFIPWINTEKLNQIRKQIDASKEKNSLIEAKDSFEKLKTNISGKFAWPFENQVAYLLYFIKEYWENIIPWINTKNIEEMEKEMTVREVKKNLNEVSQDITEWRWFAVQRKIDSLRKFIYAYRNEGMPDMPWLTAQEIVEIGQKIKDITIKSNEILWRVQKWQIKFAKKDYLFIAPDNGDYDIRIENPKGNYSEWDTVEFIIKKDWKVSLKEIVEA